MKQAGQKSVKEEPPKQRKGPKRAVEYQLKVTTHIWDVEAAGSSLATPIHTTLTHENNLNSLLLGESFGLFVIFSQF